MLQDITAARSEALLRRELTSRDGAGATDPIPITLPTEEASTLAMAPILDGQLDNLPSEEAEAIEDSEPNPEHTEYVTNTDKQGRVHIALRAMARLAPVLWTTRCGWKFGVGFNAERDFFDSEKRQCPTCFGQRRLRRRNGAAWPGSDESDSAGH